MRSTLFLYRNLIKRTILHLLSSNNNKKSKLLRIQIRKFHTLFTILKVHFPHKLFLNIHHNPLPYRRFIFNTKNPTMPNPTKPKLNLRVLILCSDVFMDFFVFVADHCTFCLLELFLVSDVDVYCFFGMDDEVEFSFYFIFVIDMDYVLAFW